MSSKNNYSDRISSHVFIAEYVLNPPFVLSLHIETENYARIDAFVKK